MAVPEEILGLDLTVAILVVALVVVVLLACWGVRSAFPKEDDMFRRFPSCGRAHLPGLKETVATPFHNYSSDTLLIHGWADAAAVKSRLPAGFHPVTNAKTGKAICTFWVVNYRKTTVGPYKELVVVYVVADEPGVTITCGSVHCVNVINTRPGVRQYIDKLWLDEALPIEYGRHLLGCDKYKGSVMQVDRTGDTLDFKFVDEKEGDELLSGSLDVPESFFGHYVAHLPFLVWEMGLTKATFFVINPSEFIRWAATGPPGVGAGLAPAVPLDASPLWGAIFVTDPRFTWHKRGDILKVGKRFEFLKFEPALYQHDRRLKAVLLGAWGHKRHDGAVADAV
jgi:hypothetical protein